MEVGNYYLGIDAGTDSVGWAVTDNQYNVIGKKANLYGVYDYLTELILHRKGVLFVLYEEEMREKNKE